MICRYLQIGDKLYICPQADTSTSERHNLLTHKERSGGKTGPTAVGKHTVLYIPELGWPYWPGTLNTVHRDLQIMCVQERVVQCLQLPFEEDEYYYRTIPLVVGIWYWPLVPFHHHHHHTSLTHTVPCIHTLLSAFQKKKDTILTAKGIFTAFKCVDFLAFSPVFQQVILLFYLHMVVCLYLLHPWFILYRIIWPMCKN